MPIEHSPRVCDLRAVSVIGVIFGHYSDLDLSPRKQQIILLYCALVPLTCICSHFYFNCDYSFLFMCDVLLVLVYYFISVYTKSNYLYEYYNFIPIIDGAPGSEKMYAKLATISAGYPALVFLEVFLLLCKFYPIAGLLGVTIAAPVICYQLLNRIPLMLIFSLLYCRVKMFRKNLSMTDMRLSRENKFILAYTALGNSLKETGRTPMFLLCVQVGDWFFNILWSAFAASRFFKEGQELDYTTLSISVLYIALDTFLVFYPCIMLELVAEEMEQSRIFLADQLLICKDEVKRKKLEELQYFMRRQPIEYKVWQVVPVNGKLPLALVAVGANYLVCALQFSNTFGSAGNRTNTTAPP